MKKQFLCLVLAVMMIFSMISYTVVATGEENPSEAVVSDTSSTTESETPEEISDAKEISVGIISDELTENVVEFNEKSATYVARIGDAQYATLQEALNDAKDGAITTITLLTDVRLEDASLEVPPGKKVVLDLGGHTITGVPTQAGEYKVIEVAQEMDGSGKSVMAELTIMNGSVVCDCSMLPTGSLEYAVDTIRNHGSLTIQNATIENKSVDGQLGYAVDNHSGFASTTVTVENGIIKTSGSNYSDGIRQYDIRQGEFMNTVTISNDSYVSSIWRQSDATLSKTGMLDAVAKAIFLDDESGQYFSEYCRTVYLASGFALQPGDKVSVLKDSLKEGRVSITVQEGTILDLNGKTVKMTRVCFIDGEVIDSADGEGCLIASTCDFYGVPTICLPLYDEDEGGYRFFNYSIRFGRDIKTYAPDWNYLALLEFTNTRAYEILANGDADLTLNAKISLKESGDSSNGYELPLWTLQAESMAEYAVEQMNAANGSKKTVGVLLSGLEEFNGWTITVELYFESMETGFYKASGAKSHTINITPTETIESQEE